MIKRNQLSTIHRLIPGSQLLGDDQAFSSLSIDTRTIQPDELFIALKGPHFDGHDYIAIAKQQGAVAAVVEKPMGAEKTGGKLISQLVVEDSRIALGLIGQINREDFSGPLVALTGSSGKTTVKEMLAAIFKQQGPTLSTAGNLNNDLGAPLTLSRLTAEHRYAVIELGANTIGEIAYTSRLSQPTICLINNVMAAHLEGFGSLENTAQAKGEITQGLVNNGTAIFNADDQFFDYWKTLLSGNQKLLSFSVTNTEANVYATHVELIDQGFQFKIHLLDHCFSVTLPLPGRHNIANALAAATAAFAAGCSPQAIALGLQEMQPVAGRGVQLSGKKGSRLIDDTYNANPGSVKAAIQLLAQYPGKRILVLGEMGELGEKAGELHFEVGQFAKQQGLDGLYAVGLLTEQSVIGFGEGAQHFTNKAELVEFLDKQLSESLVVLIKGSRSAKMETVVAACRMTGGNG
ncbi:UDP-N-acetylmuramoyl-tripeptide--D-alanyl-D-alanine ligase [Endozoicomonas sp. SM1973]|uniref:UDP-N-acetylmuramoyl-tripeptide--D-alanyl-D-alanine ligase n=1 Tax=Spartinivicinus marinus TaxID=2994442 RepID=A0A853IDX6_9GAMM|nr:UDP-N-acetylmuramoyl-tripeptide--D-alanyl-D-alanine ligase [Spartinivicinus marinus]MCX4028311.1 UDP-N-acetylmuramoyl-tripeptide--D-alanyl-D-alanine ligase [Spartinivicinus marinus]NYZ65646.1 UDP-N-acetylmuramoyl-tripeptide--D-alanyl-D-alanine ligase [Spartinivicinus marinus]